VISRPCPRSSHPGAAVQNRPTGPGPRDRRLGQSVRGRFLPTGRPRPLDGTPARGPRSGLDRQCVIPRRTAAVLCGDHAPVKPAAPVVSLVAIRWATSSGQLKSALAPQATASLVQRRIARESERARSRLTGNSNGFPRAPRACQCPALCVLNTKNPVGTDLYPVLQTCNRAPQGEQRPMITVRQRQTDGLGAEQR
jgi:hypothetical protein